MGRATVPFVQLKVTILEDPDTAMLMRREGGAAAIGIFALLLADARRRRNGGVFDCSLDAIASVLFTTADAIRDAVRVIDEVCRANRSDPWLILTDDALVIRSFEKYQDNRGGMRENAGRRPSSHASEIKKNQSGIKGTADSFLIATQNPESRNQNPETNTPPTPPQSVGDARNGVASYSRFVLPEHEAIVDEIIDAWNEVRTVSNRRIIRESILEAVDGLQRRSRPTVDPETVRDSGGPLRFLLAQTRAYAKSDLARAEGGKYRYQAKSFFVGTKNDPPKFAMDPSEWTRPGGAEDAMARLMRVAGRSEDD